MEGLVFGLASSSVLLAEFDVPRLRESQSFTQSGTDAEAKAAGLSARIHMSASACLQGNFLLGHVHLYPAAASLITTRYGVAPEPWHSPQASPSPSANVGQEDGFSNFRAAASQAWSGASASTLSNVSDILRIVEHSSNDAKLLGVDVPRLFVKRIGLQPSPFTLNSVPTD